MIEDLIYGRLAGCEDLEGLLARFDNSPAIFYQTAAHNDDPKWTSESRYPRVDFVLDTQAQPARNMSGALIVNVWCDMAGGVQPEQIEGIIRGLFHHAIVQEHGADAHCITWTRSDNFEATNQTEQGTTVAGYTMVFAVLGMPVVETTDPCPLKAINDFTKTNFPDAVIIGLDEIDGWLESGRVAIYWELVSLRVDKRTNVCLWWICNLTCHVFAVNDQEKIEMSCWIADCIGAHDFVMMRDRSPMRHKTIEVNTASDSVMGGQVSGSFTYGELIYDHFKDRHTGIIVNYPKINNMSLRDRSRAASAFLQAAQTIKTTKVGDA